MKAAAVAAALVVALFAAPAAASKSVDLNAPGALERLRHDNPGDYAKVRRILAEVQDQRSENVLSWMLAQFDAREVAYAADLLLTSYPPQKRLSFSLGDTRYFGTVTLTRDRAQAIPAAR